MTLLHFYVFAYISSLLPRKLSCWYLELPKGIFVACFYKSYLAWEEGLWLPLHLASWICWRFALNVGDGWFALVDNHHFMVECQAGHES